jgi:hypothetical protein
MNSWYFKRLAAMSVRELPYRLNQVIRKKYEEYYWAGRDITDIQIPLNGRILDVQITDKHLFPAEIDIFGKLLNYSGNEINWHSDIFSGKSFPLIFSKKINIRKDTGLSAKNVWEVNRLQFLVHIALNYHHTGDTEYLNQFIGIMSSWIDNNPYLIGINWHSNIEINIRLINWYFCWEILDAGKLIKQNPQFEKFVLRKWIPSIYQHCKYSYNNPSRFSSANNHLIAEYSGLFIASSKWKFKESGSWMKYAVKGLEKEIVAQHSNGVNKEEAAEYIQFITDFFLLSFVIGEKTNNHFSKTYVRTLKSIFEYILAFTDIKGNYPNYGDGDDGKVVSFEAEKHFNNFISLLTSASIIFRDSKFKLGTTSFDLKNQILFGNPGKEIFESLPQNVKSRSSVFYTKEGHHIFRNQTNGKEIYLHFNAAPLGYLSLAAHGHADALSFILNINGHFIMVDPGTYSYHVSQKWRNYFVSTMAHNTICIDGRNQADQAGDTMWFNHYKCQMVEEKHNDILESVRAEHDGYKRTKHRREIWFNKPGNSFTVSDELFLSDENEQECALLYHLHPDIKVEKLSPNMFSLFHQSGIRLSVSMLNFDDCSIINGEEDPVLGWHSDSFMKKAPTNVLYAKRRIKKSFKSVTKILIYEY